MGLLSSIGSFLGGPFGAIAGAVAPPLIQGLFGRKAQKDANKNKGVDYAKLRDDAIAGGFNPLTALLAGGGAGYQSTFDPALSSGSFVTEEAVSRGLDTYFNTPSKTDREVQRIRRDLEAETYRQQAQMAQGPQRFGYSLADQRPFRPVIEDYTPALAASTGRPPVNPLDRDPSYIPVRHPDGSRGQLEASIADRLGIKPFHTVSAGDWAEIVGELGGEAEMALGTEKVRDTAISCPIFAEPGHVSRYRERQRRKAADAASKTRKWSRGVFAPQYQLPEFSRPWGAY